MPTTATQLTRGQADEAQQELFTGYRVRIAIFEGPLDLLLYLVKRNEVDIYEVRVSEITDEFLGYLRTMQELNVELAGDFLVVAASLLLIKSRMLLPLEESAAAEEDEEELDPQIELAERLLAYRTFKEASELLEESRQLRDRIYLRAPAEDGDVGTGFVMLEHVSVFDLVSVFRDLLERATEPPPTILQREAITVAQCIRHVLDALAHAPPAGLTFYEILPEPLTRLMVITTFLAVLELMRRRRIRVKQARPGAPILVSLALHGDPSRYADDADDTPDAEQQT
jgi:segregation and condensation protein A